MAVLSPLVFAACFALWVKLTYSGPGCPQPDVEIPGPLADYQIVLALVAASVGGYAWRRGQPVLVLVPQVIFSLVLTVILLWFALGLVGAFHECFD